MPIKVYGRRDVVISPNNMSSTNSDKSFRKSDDIKEYSKIKDSIAIAETIAVICHRDYFLRESRYCGNCFGTFRNSNVSISRLDHLQDRPVKHIPKQFLWQEQQELF
jgi:hypothetical protein